MPIQKLKNKKWKKQELINILTLKNYHRHWMIIFYYLKFINNNLKNEVHNHLYSSPFKMTQYNY